MCIRDRICRNASKTSQNTIRLPKGHIKRDLCVNSTFTLLDTNKSVTSTRNAPRKLRNTFGHLSIRNRSKRDVVLPRVRLVRKELRSRGFKEFVRSQQKEGNRSMVCNKENNLEMTISKMPKKLNQLLNIKWKSTPQNELSNHGKVPRMIFRNLYCHTNTKA
eukprot:TRINITY_DN13148_c0_g1_i1.p1 TRINITY_DN13148_c0_g1~~TRINITY_DN13148_c0_g1_i1.p1  ORF type:complete len:162 (+),score=31.66 TRINITY_DN13148_c0_g1_i1:79-564(+)